MKVLAQATTCTSSLFFRCHDGSGCIANRYVCDWKADCQDQSDEIGCKDPCRGKLKCLDGRCVDPRTCCNPHTDLGCDRWKRAMCCDDRLNSIYGPQKAPQSKQEVKTIQIDRQAQWDLGTLAMPVFVTVSAALMLTVTVIAVAYMAKILIGRLQSGRHRHIYTAQNLNNSSSSSDRRRRQNHHHQQHHHHQQNHRSINCPMLLVGGELPEEGVQLQDFNMDELFRNVNAMDAPPSYESLAVQSTSPLPPPYTERMVSMGTVTNGSSAGVRHPATPSTISNENQRINANMDTDNRLEQ